METSWTETAKIDAYLLEDGPIEEYLLFEAQLQLDTELNMRIQAQQRVHDYAIAYGRLLLREEIQQLDQQLFTDNKFKQFQQKVIAFFR